MNIPTNHDHFNELVSESLKTSSKVVAEAFGKRHTEVIRAIRDMIEKEPEWGVRNFASFKINDLTGESTSHYEMTRDGYSMLVMGFTGKKAMEWKIKFLEAFNAMEERLRANAMPAPMADLSDPGVLLPLLTSYAQRTQVAEGRVAELSPKAIAYDRLDASEGAVNVRIAAKMLDVPERKFTKWLEANGWAFRQNGIGPLQAYVDKRNRGYLEHRAHTYHDNQRGEDKTVAQMMITPKGLARLSQIFSKQGAPA